MNNPQTYPLAKRVEKFIYSHLEEHTLLSAPDSQVSEPRLRLFKLVCQGIDPTISTGFFNKIISDMVTVGLVGITHRGGHLIFLAPEVRAEILSRVTSSDFTNGGSL